MDLDTKYTFLPLNKKSYYEIENKKTQDYLMKWGMKDTLMIQNFSFNEPFQNYNKYQLIEQFFKSDIVARSLFVQQGSIWTSQGIAASTVDVQQVPCTVLNMSFFDKLNDPENGIVSSSGAIVKTYDTEIDGFLVSDNLKGMFLDEESQGYNLYNEFEKREFIYRVLKLLVLGGSLCQYEDRIQPYLEVTKSLYKDLIRVIKKPNSEELAIGTLVMEVIAKDHHGEAFFPKNPSNKQNVGFVLVDGLSRGITTILHQYNSWFK